MPGEQQVNLLLVKLGGVVLTEVNGTATTLALDRRAVCIGKYNIQHRVSLEQRREGLLHGPDVNVRGEFCAEGQIVGRAVRRQPVQVPKCLLPFAQREFASR